MRIRLALAGLCVFVSVSAAAELTGKFYLEKETFAQGEPVFLYLSLVNKGPDVADLTVSDPDQPGCDGIGIKVSSDESGASCPASKAGFLRDRLCVLNGQFQSVQLLPGQAYTLRYLLNFQHDIAATGDYPVDAKYTGSPMTIGETRTSVEETHASIAFHVGADTVASSEWKPWLDQLKSVKREARLEAAKTLASLAPPSLEETLLGFADIEEFRRYSTMAFNRLNTPRSLEALAHYVEPLLRDNVSCAVYAAILGGEKMLPELVAQEKSPDRPTRMNAVTAMGYTRSRADIPILVELVKDPDVRVGYRAVYSLRQLTHRTSYGELQAPDPTVQYIQWSSWWEREGATAPIYADSECGEVVPLP